MDWKEDPRSNLWIFPRGMERNGQAGSNSLKWVSKYGSVITSAYDICTTDGMNEKGLVANLLWLAESEYPARDGRKPGLSVAAWTQYVLDNFATVDEAVEALAKDDFDVASDLMRTAPGWLRCTSPSRTPAGTTRSSNTSAGNWSSTTASRTR